MTQNSFIGQLGPVSAKLSFCRAALVFAALSGVATMMGGCSISLPIGSFMASDDVTGSIAKPSSPLSNDLDSEDWRRAKSAMGVALDPQGNGTSVAWDNPASGAKGSFVPVAQAIPVGDKICRAFIAHLDVRGTAQSLQGQACYEKGHDWQVGDVRPWKKGA